MSKDSSSIYSKIALDIAVRIARGELKEGAKISGRSLLAGEYKVSPETIRRAISLLGEMDIVSVQTGNGIIIKSQNNASKYLERFNSTQTILGLRNDISALARQKADIEVEMMANIDKIIDYCERLKNLNPIYPIEFEIPKDSPVIGKATGDLKFWQSTGATVVGIRRNSEVIISPGPLSIFEGGDIILAVGDPSIVERVKQFLKPVDQTEDNTGHL